MPHINIQPECLPCLENLIDLTVNLATAEPDLREKARLQARAILAAEFSPAAISACIANKFHQAIKNVTGNPDPFLPRKRQETEMARNIAARLVPGLGSTPTAPLTFAAAGNALDFFRAADEIARDMMAQVFLSNSQVRLWQQQVDANPPGLLLFLADNAGEQYFDLPLVQSLRESGWQVLYVVKGGPIQNDLTRQDLSHSGLQPALEPVIDTGAETVGLELPQTTPEFQHLFAAADLILAKGMGHFETLSHLSDPRLFFLLQAKCPPVAAALSAPVGAFVLRNASI
jgi:damage-control phosphatase, subfamily I